MKNTQRGFSNLLGLFFALILIIAGVFVYFYLQQKEEGQDSFVSIGDTLGKMTVTNIAPFNSNFSEIGPENIKIMLKGPIEITGTYEFFESEMGFSGYCMSNFDTKTLSKLPYVPTHLPLRGEYGKPRDTICFRNEDFTQKELGKSKQKVTVKIDVYELNSYPAEVMDFVNLVEVVSKAAL